MTDWGFWTCPECGNEWVGSIGYFWSQDVLSPEAEAKEEEELNKLLISICGCTGEGVTSKQMDKMGGIYTRGPNIKSEEGP